MMRNFRFLSVMAVAMLGAASAVAGNLPFFLTVDEDGFGIIQFTNGTGGAFNGFLGADPSGGSPTGLALQWRLPSIVGQGDVVFTENPDGTEPYSELLRFFNDAQGSLLIFYSDADPLDFHLADQGIPDPAHWQPGFVIQQEDATGRCRWDPSPYPINNGYLAISEGSVPEPATFIGLAVGLVGLARLRRKR